jgi:hypothetical protein
MNSESEKEIQTALDAGRQAWVQERDEAEKSLLAEADVREAFGDTEAANHLRATVEYGRQITDRHR